MSPAVLGQVGDRLDVSGDVVAAALERAGVPRRPRAPRALDAAGERQAVELYAEGLSLGQVGDRLDVSRPVVARALERAGVPRRPRAPRALDAQPTREEIVADLRAVVQEARAMQLHVTPEVTTSRQPALRVEGELVTSSEDWRWLRIDLEHGRTRTTAYDGNGR